MACVDWFVAWQCIGVGEVGLMVAGQIAALAQVNKT